MWLARIFTLVICLSALGFADTGFIDRTVVVEGRTYRYQLYVPSDYTPAKQWPVIVDLHGNMLQGEEGLFHTQLGLAHAIRARRDAYPVLCILPQAPRGEYWEQRRMQLLVLAQLDATEREFNVDKTREYLTGFSMGAVGAYRIAYRWPDRFAALVAIAGMVEAINIPDRVAGDRETNPFTTEQDPFGALAAVLKVVPSRIYHGDADRIVPVEQSRRLTAALNNAGASTHYIEIPAADHLEGALKAYGDPDFMTWLLAQHRPPQATR